MAGISGYGSNVNYHNAVRSQHESSGYSYQSPEAATHHANQYQPYSDHFGTSYFGTSTQNQPQEQSQSNTSTNLAAAALSSLSANDHNQRSSKSSRDSNATHFNAAWPSQPYSTNSLNVQANQQAQKIPLPSYSNISSTGAATFGRLTLPEQRQQASTSTFRSLPSQKYQSTSSGSNLQSYQVSPEAGSSTSHLYNNSQDHSQWQPQRYASPMHAAQVQPRTQNDQLAGARSTPSNHAPQTNARSSSHERRQPDQESAVVDNLQTTIDPSKVYYWRAEQQQRTSSADEERLRSGKEGLVSRESAARANAERTAVEAEGRQSEAGHRQAEVNGRVADEHKRALAAKRKEAKEKKKADRTRKAEASKLDDSPVTAIAPAEVQLSGQNSSQDEEAQMRAMFKKMREFNQKNPTMLAKLWEEERKAHNEVADKDTAGSLTTPAPQAAPKQPEIRARTESPAISAVDKSGLPPQVLRAGTTTPHNVVTSNTLATKTALQSVSGLGNSQAVSGFWPQHKKGSLSETAANWLSMLPVNVTAGRTISKHDLLKMLEKNPSYVQLCEELESRGIAFERSAFARGLLKSMQETASKPEGAHGSAYTGQQKPRSSQATPLQPHDGLVRYQSPAFPSLVEHANPADAAPMLPSGGITTTLPSALSDTTPQSHQKSATVDSEPVAMHKTLPGMQAEGLSHPSPANKEEAARKRTFDDLIDLTKNDSDDDEEGPPPKLLQTSFGSARLPDDQIRPVAPEATFSQPVSYRDFMQMSQLSKPYTRPMQAAPSVPLPVAPQTGPSQTLPVPPKPANSQQLEMERRQKSRMKGTMLVEPIMRDRVARKSKYDSGTIARDVLLATGRHPDMRALNSHLNVMQKLLGDHGGMVGGMPGSEKGNRSDLSTIRWDIIDPGEPSKEAQDKRRSPASRGGAFSEEEDTEANDGLHIGTMLAQRKSSFVAHDFEESANSTRPETDKRSRTGPSGRPGQSTVAPAATSTPARTSPHMQTPVQPPEMPTGTPTGYAAFRQTTTDENGNIVKKKGRPVGWRKSIHSREAQGLLPYVSHSKKTPTSLRDAKPASTAKASRNLQEPHYPIYACGWVDCSAELHNLDTLKKHMVKLHGKPSNGKYHCAWKDCGLRGSQVNSDRDERDVDVSETASFPTIEPWMRHVEEQHLQPIAWKLGDGPGVGEEGHRSSAAYLTDEDGRSVTPIIAPFLDHVSTASACLPGDLSEWQEYGQPPERHAARDANAAAAELRKLEELKTIVGPIFGPEGTKLANSKRRRGFLDDEDFEDIVDSD